MVTLACRQVTWTFLNVPLSVLCHIFSTDSTHILATNVALQQQGVYSITHWCKRRQDLTSEYLCQAGCQPAMDLRKRDAASLISGCTAVFSAEAATDCSDGTSIDSREPESSIALSPAANQAQSIMHDNNGDMRLGMCRKDVESADTWLGFGNVIVINRVSVYMHHKDGTHVFAL